VAVGSDDEPEGFVSVWEPEAFIHHLYVRPRLPAKGRRRGAARFPAHSTTHAWRLKCLRANVRALAFYLGQGWTEISSGDGEDGPFAVLEKRET